MNWKTSLIALLCTAISIVSVKSQNYLMNAATQNISVCRGYFMDSGGSLNSYGPNQNFTTTICPDRTSGTHTQLIFSGTQVSLGDELCFFDGRDKNAPSLGCVREFDGASSFIIQATAANSSGCVTVTFISDGVLNGAGWSAEIKCSAACQLIRAELTSTSPAAVPIDTGWINVCPGGVVDFSGKGIYPQNGLAYLHSDKTSEFVWDFGDGTIEKGTKVSHQFDKPGGYIVQLRITDQFGCKSTNFIKQRVRVSPKPHFEISSYPAEICVGDTVNLNAKVDAVDKKHTVSVTSAEAKFQTQGVRSDSLALPDGTGASYRTTIGFNGFSPGQLLTDINTLLGIWVNMEHSWLRDLQIRITCPNGQNVVLHDHPGRLGGEVHLGIPFQGDEGLPKPVPGFGYEYGWAPTPKYNHTWIGYSNTFLPSTLPPGTYKSFQSLDRLLQCPLNGDWTIEVTDLWAIDNGFIFSWGIAFDPSLYPSLEVFSPSLNNWAWEENPTVFSATRDSIKLSSNNAGDFIYTFGVNDEFGCAWDTSVQVKVLPSNHLDCYNCLGSQAFLRDTIVCIDEPVKLDASRLLTPIDTIAFETYSNYKLGHSNHPPSTPYKSVISVNSVFPDTLTNPASQIVSVCLDLETDATGDIHLILESPSGELMVLSSNNGGTGDNFTKTCFTPNAPQLITVGSPPYTGNFRPQGSWTAFTNVNANGKWTLWVTDASGLGNLGTLKGWSITFRSFNNVTYSWSPPDVLSCKDCPTPETTTPVSANYSVIVTDRYGCLLKDTMSVEVINHYQAPVVTCEDRLNGEVLVSWSDIHPGLRYEVNINGKGWQPANDSYLSHVVRGLVLHDTVSAQVRVAVGRVGCQVDIGRSFCTLKLCIAKAVPFPAPPYSVTCNGDCDGKIQISVQNGSPPYRYDYTNLSSGSSISQNSDTLANLCPGSYKLFMTDNTNCMDSLAFNVANPPIISISASQVSPVSCKGGTDGCATVTATGGGGNFSYVWGNANMSLGKNICALQAGKVNVSATDALGCKAISSVDITEPAALTLAMSKSDVKCYGEKTGIATVAPSGGNGSFVYQWSGGDTPRLASTTNLLSGNYSVTVQDSKACIAFGNVTINQPATPVSLSANQTVRSCYNLDKGASIANASGGVGPYTYLWSPGGQTTRTAQNLKPGLYQVIATDANSCTASTSINAVQWNPVLVSISEKPPTCNGLSNGLVAANIVTGGDGKYQYAWSTGSKSDFVDSLKGGFTYILTVTDGQGCTGTGSKALTNPPAIVAQTTLVQPKCSGGSDGAIAIQSILYNQGAVKYLWDAAARNKITPTVDSLSSGTYTVLISDTMGCSSNVRIILPQSPPIVTSAKVTDNGCFGEKKGTIDLAVSGGAPSYKLNWSNGSASSKLNDLPAGSYKVSITDANGCIKLDSVAVREPSTVSIATTVKDATCNGDKDGSITILSTGGTPPYSYSLTGSAFSGSNQIIALSSGDYTVYARDSRGCVYTKAVKVNQPLPFVVEILAGGLNLNQHIIQSGDSILLEARIYNSNGKAILTWESSYCGTLRCNGISDCKQTPFCQQLWASPLKSVDYVLVAIDEKGCEAKDRLQLHVRLDRKVLVPTGFTPNQDGNNDFLSVHGKSDTKIKRFQIFDRWGELIYQMLDVPINDKSSGWDGNFKNKPMPAGVYVWYLEVEFNEGKTESYRGETTLIR